MIVYLVSNRFSGKAYVGQTKRGLEQRWHEHVRDALKGRTEMGLYYAIRKHGADAFDTFVLEECSSDDAMDAAEKRWIAELGTYGGGYNQTEGGDGLKGYHHTEATKKRMSEYRKGRPMPPGHGEKISKAQRGVARPHVGKKFEGSQNPMAGRHHSAEARDRISIGSCQHAREAIPVRQLDTEGNVLATYSSMTQGSLAVGGKGRGVKACCEGRQQVYRGFHWEYARG